MRKEKISKAKARLLDHWVIPDNAGDPVGCLATTYTFQADFFEEECLTRFLGMESNPVDDGPVYLIEREEKLNSISCAAIWVDQSYARQLRNMRWDLIPFSLGQSILHAKITVLRWTAHLRVMVASANLTEEGYRKNHEVMAVLDLNGDNNQDKFTITSILNMLAEWMNSNEWASSGVNQRSLNFIRNNIQFANSIPDPVLNLRNQEYLSYPVIVEPGKPSFIDQVSNIWKEQFGNVGPSYFEVVSPFFDPPGEKNLPALRTWEIMKKKGGAEMHITTSGEFVNDEPYRIHAPQSLDQSLPSGRNDIFTAFSIISPISEEDKANRSLHAKCYWLTNDAQQTIYIIGSSNFTSRGLGLSSQSNIEANIAVVSDGRRYKDFLDTLEQSMPAGDEIDPETIKWEPIPDDETDALGKEIALHPFFQSATIRRFENNALYLELKFKNDNAPSGFIVSTQKNKILLTHSGWLEIGKPLIYNTEINEENLPSFLLITWDEAGAEASIPVNIEDQKCLPPPEELRNLPLSVLNELITSAKPIHNILRKYLLSKTHSYGSDIELDPLKKYDSSSYLLQRTRKYSLAINLIKNRLEKPFPTESSLEWRLYGPVGIKAAVDAIIREAIDKSEAIFFISEILKTLAKVTPAREAGTLSHEIVLREVKKFRDSLKEIITRLWEESDNDQIKNYSKKLLQTI